MESEATEITEATTRHGKGPAGDYEAFQPAQIAIGNNVMA